MRAASRHAPSSAPSCSSIVSFSFPVIFLLLPRILYSLPSKSGYCNSPLLFYVPQFFYSFCIFSFQLPSSFFPVFCYVFLSSSVTVSLPSCFMFPGSIHFVSFSSSYLPVIFLLLVSIFYLSPSVSWFLLRILHVS